MKKILVVNYSQSGQLDQIIQNFLTPFDENLVEKISIKPKNPYPFPWNGKKFFDTMPETVMEDTIELEPIHFEQEKYDLIILGYQPWFLSPSLPTTALLKNEEFQKRVKNSPVVTIIGARNMWLNSQDSIKKYIKNAGGKIVANIPFSDRHQNQLSVLTILYWMVTGKKKRMWNILPEPGVSGKDIKEASKYGEIINSCFEEGNYTAAQDNIRKIEEIEIKTGILFIESRAKKLFIIWAKLIQKKSKKNRWIWTKLFSYYLLFALFIVAPILTTIYFLLIVPFTYTSIKKKKAYFRAAE